MSKQSIRCVPEASAIQPHERRGSGGAFFNASMAGALVGLGNVLSFTVGTYVIGSWSLLVTETIFSLALTIVMFAGAELFTSKAMTMSVALFAGRAETLNALTGLAAAWWGNLFGSLLFAGLVHLAGGGALLGDDGSMQFYATVAAKMSAGPATLLMSGLVCNWLVCLAICMAQHGGNAAAKIALLFVPTLLFVALGFDHSVANMFSFSLALLGEHPAAVTPAGALHNLVWVGLGNLMGGLVFMPFPAIIRTALAFYNNRNCFAAKRCDAESDATGKAAALSGCLENHVEGRLCPAPDVSETA